jgi:hypothetical protein
MIRIDADSHFTPIDAFAGVDAQHAAIGPKFVELPNGGYLFDYPARAPFVPEHIKQIRLKGHGRNRSEYHQHVAGTRRVVAGRY